jgi:hypothetical protein
MNLKGKIHLENQKKLAHGKLAARTTFLKEKGLDGAVIQRDALIRKMKAEIRKANYRLACIAAQEKLNADKAQAKAKKLAAGKNLRDMPPAEIAKGVPGKRGKKEKKIEPSPASKEQE